MKTARTLARLTAATCLAANLAAGQSETNGARYVTQEEYDKLKQEVGELKAALKPPASSNASDRLLEMERDAGPMRRAAKDGAAGTTKMLIAGDADVDFTAPERDSSTFGAAAGLMLLWEMQQHLFFEGGLLFTLNGPDANGENSDTKVDVMHVDITYLLNDYTAVGAGLFPVPFAMYHTHIEKAWINKVPADPLVFGDNGIAPDSAVGLFVLGRVPVCSTLFNYGLYVGNGPALVTEDPAAAGSLNFGNYNDINKNKAVGGRIGFLPVAGIEMGFSMMLGTVSPSGFEDVKALLYAADFNCVQACPWVDGRITLRGEWIWSNVDTATYDPDGALGFGPLTFTNHRNGGYVEVAYRPLHTGLRPLENVEFVFRYDRLSLPSDAPGGFTEDQWTPGIDYWLTPRCVLKLAYVFDHRNDGQEQNAFMTQCAIGF
jgi:hypothetical protein